MTTSTDKENSGLNWNRLFDLPGMRDDSGRANVEAAIEFIRTEGIEYLAKNEIDPEVIQNALDAVHKKSNKTHDEIANLALGAFNELTSVPEGGTSKAIERIKKYLRTQNLLFRAGKNGKYYITNGRNVGGVYRVTPELVEELKKKQEASK